MPRREETVQVPKWPGNRDADKLFHIREMSALRAEKWAAKAFLAVTRSGVTIPDNVRGLGIVGVALVGFQILASGGIRFDDIEPLMDEMFTCIRMVRDPKAVDRNTGGPVITDLFPESDDIEEVQTRMWLRLEVLRIHTNFPVAESLSKWTSQMMSQEPITETM